MESTERVQVLLALDPSDPQKILVLYASDVANTNINKYIVAMDPRYKVYQVKQVKSKKSCKLIGQ